MATIHKSFEHIPNGIKVKRLDSKEISSSNEGDILHKDEYFVFGFVEAGCCEVQVDFIIADVKAGEAIIISPSQLHRILSTSDAEGYVLLIDSSLLSNEQSKILISLTRKTAKIKPQPKVNKILDNLLSILYSCNSDGTELSNSFRMSIGIAIIELFCNIAEVSNRQTRVDRYNRHAETFFALLTRDILYDRRPSYYARKMNISPVYLNESIKKVTGKNVTQNINEEVTLRAKRLLAFTKLDVKEIAHKLGFNDVAYFTKLFTKTTGCSPIHFRKNLK